MLLCLVLFCCLLHQIRKCGKTLFRCKPVTIRNIKNTQQFCIFYSSHVNALLFYCSTCFKTFFSLHCKSCFVKAVFTFLVNLLYLILLILLDKMLLLKVLKNFFGLLVHFFFNRWRLLFARES